MFYLHILEIIEKLTLCSSIQQQSPGGVLQERCSEKFGKFSQKHLCRRRIKLPASRLPIKKTQVFSYEFWEVFKNIFFEEHLRTAVS